MLILVIAFSMIRSLKVLAPFSLAANVISIGGKEIRKLIRKKNELIIYRFMYNYAICCTFTFTTE
jgi:hypothetical protein